MQTTRYVVCGVITPTPRTSDRTRRHQSGNKGADAARTAIEMADLRQL
jgi:6,7-dimethyl-8-ribityllumazine synthase